MPSTPACKYSGVYSGYAYHRHKSVLHYRCVINRVAESEYNSENIEFISDYSDCFVELLSSTQYIELK